VDSAAAASRSRFPVRLALVACHQSLPRLRDPQRPCRCGEALSALLSRLSGPLLDRITCSGDATLESRRTCWSPCQLSPTAPTTAPNQQARTATCRSWCRGPVSGWCSATPAGLRQTAP